MRLNELGERVPFQVTAQGAARASQLPRPLGDGLRAIIVCETNVHAPIVELVDRQRPANVPRFVVAVVVDPVELVAAARPRPHVGDEVGERRVPSLAHANPAASVVLVTRRTRLVTADPHVDPDSVLAAGGTAVGRDTRPVARTRHFAPQTSTARGRTADHRLDQRVCFAPAVAANERARFRRVRRGQTDHSQPTKSLSRGNGASTRHRAHHTAY